MKITKDQLRAIQAEIGSFDTDSGRIVGGFVGSQDRASGLYVGEVRLYDVGDAEPERRVSVASIVGDGPAIPADDVESYRIPVGDDSSLAADADADE